MNDVPLKQIFETEGDFWPRRIRLNIAASAVTYARDTLWFTQAQIAEIFRKEITTVNEHIQSIKSTNLGSVERFKISKKEGRRIVSRSSLHYDLDFTCSVGIRCREPIILQNLIDQCGPYVAANYSFTIATRKESNFGDLLKTTFLDLLSFEEQFPVGGYRIDFFCNQARLAVEYDENHHRHSRQALRDLIRESTIKSVLGDIAFIRVKEGFEHEGINLILKHSLAFIR